MEMGAAITVLVFSQFSLPVSTSMCITGATVGVGLCNGTLKAVNFQRVREKPRLCLLSFQCSNVLLGRSPLTGLASYHPDRRYSWWSPHGAGPQRSSLRWLDAANPQSVEGLNQYGRHS
jgi:hypothetical protein